MFATLYFTKYFHMLLSIPDYYSYEYLNVTFV